MGSLELIVLQLSRSGKFQHWQHGGLIFGRKALGYSEAYGGRDLESSKTVRKQPLSPPGVMCFRSKHDGQFGTLQPSILRVHSCVLEDLLPD